MTRKTFFKFSQVANVINSFFKRANIAGGQANPQGIPIEVPETAETTALGAAYLAGLAVGFWDSEKDLASQWRPNARYEPQMSRDEADVLYAGWQRAMERARDWERKNS